MAPAGISAGDGGDHPNAYGASYVWCRLQGGSKRYPGKMSDRVLKFSTQVYRNMAKNKTLIRWLLFGLELIKSVGPDRWWIICLSALYGSGSPKKAGAYADVPDGASRHGVCLTKGRQR